MCLVWTRERDSDCRERLLKLLAKTVAKSQLSSDVCHHKIHARVVARASFNSWLSLPWAAFVTDLHLGKAKPCTIVKAGRLLNALQLQFSQFSHRSHLDVVSVRAIMSKQRLLLSCLQEGKEATRRRWKHYGNSNRGSDCPLSHHWPQFPQVLTDTQAHVSV